MRTTIVLWFSLVSLFFAGACAGHKYPQYGQRQALRLPVSAAVPSTESQPIVFEAPPVSEVKTADPVAEVSQEAAAPLVTREIVPISQILSSVDLDVTKSLWRARQEGQARINAAANDSRPRGRASHGTTSPPKADTIFADVKDLKRDRLRMNEYHAQFMREVAEIFPKDVRADAQRDTRLAMARTKRAERIAAEAQRRESVFLASSGTPNWKREIMTDADPPKDPPQPLAAQDTRASSSKDKVASNDAKPPPGPGTSTPLDQSGPASAQSSNITFITIAVAVGIFILGIFIGTLRRRPNSFQDDHDDTAREDLLNTSPIDIPAEAPASEENAPVLAAGSGPVPLAAPDAVLVPPTEAPASETAPQTLAAGSGPVAKLPALVIKSSGHVSRGSTHGEIISKDVHAPVPEPDPPAPDPIGN